MNLPRQSFHTRKRHQRKMKGDFRVLTTKPVSTGCKRKKNIKKRVATNEAMLFCCKRTGTRYSAIKSGLFPLVKNRRTINKQLDGKIITGQEKNYCSILLPDEKDTCGSMS